jgi:hypothetical protein
MPQEDKQRLGDAPIELKQADEARLAVYEALRAESDRIAQLLSNAVWAGITGFGLTLAGAAALADKVITPLIVPSAALLLCIQSLAISTVYASELWKYIRVGTYIRVYIEPYFQILCGGVTAPMRWESWIVKHRARALHTAALLFLQGPVGLIILACLTHGLIQHIPWITGTGKTTGQYVEYLAYDPGLAIFLFGIITLDAILMFVLYRKLNRAEKWGDFGDGGKSLKELEIAVRGGFP